MTTKNWQTRRANGWKPSAESKARMSKSAKLRCGDPIDIFWSKVSKRIVKHPRVGYCWIWTGCKDKDGYGLIVIDKVSTRTHRLSYQLHTGNLPKDMMVCHNCDTPSCVNPSHLFLGDYRTNSDDKIKKMRHSYGERSGTALLKEEQVLVVINLPPKTSLGPWAIEFGVCIGTLEAIRSGRTWKHLPRSVL